MSPTRVLRRSPGRGDRVQWELAGLTDPRGRVDRPLPIPSTGLFVPESIEVVGPSLVYRWGNGKQVAPGPGLLGDFVELHKKPDSEILGYARRWGVFGQVCADHWLPASHREDVCSPIASADEAGETPGTGSEPLEFWRCWSWQARALLNIASSLHCDERGNAEDWAAILWWAWQIDPKHAEWRELSEAAQRAALLESADYFGQTVRQQRDSLAAVVSTWLYHARVRPWFGWGPDGPSLEFNTGGRLYGELGLQLALAAAGADALTTCASCGRTFPRDHRPGRRRRYCQTCGTRARWRLAQARHAARSPKATRRPQKAAKGVRHG